MTTMRPNAWGLLTEEQAKAALRAVELGVEEMRVFSLMTDERVCEEEIQTRSEQYEYANQAYELLAAERFPRHADEHVLFQLQQAGIRPTDERHPEDVVLPVLAPDEEIHAIRQVLGVLGEEGGYGDDYGFIGSLVRTLFAADTANQIKLLHTFPAVTLAVLRYKGGDALGPSGADGLRHRITELT